MIEYRVSQEEYEKEVKELKDLGLAFEDEFILRYNLESKEVREINKIIDNEKRIKRMCEIFNRRKRLEERYARFVSAWNGFEGEEYPEILF